MVARRPSASSPDRVQVPHLNKDPVWSLRPWPAVIRVAGQDFEVPPLVAADWLAVLMVEDFSMDEFIMLILPEADDLLYETGLPLDELYEACTDLISTVSARPWWVTMRLINLARESWEVLGAELILKHVDAATLSLSAWLDALLVVTIRALDPKDVTMFTMRLEAVPETEAEEGVEPEMSAEAFLALGR